MKKKMNNKGFTLVELIVVLVILAILAAILVPALLGYIDRARESQIVLNGKSVLTAAQAEMSSAYGQGKYVDVGGTYRTGDFYNAVLNTSDVSGNAVADGEFLIGTKEAQGSGNTTNHESYVVNYVEYSEGANKIYFDGSSWSNVEPTSITTHELNPSKTFTKN